MKIVIDVINPDLNTMYSWLSLPEEDYNSSPDLFFENFNNNNEHYIQRAENWSNFNNAKLIVSDVNAQRTDDSSSFQATVIVDEIDIYEVAQALHVPSPVAKVFSLMGEKGIAVSFNTLFKINRKIISGEAVKQLEKRGMKAEGINAELIL